MNSAQDAGRRFEEEWAARVGGRATPGSGNQWFALMDANDRVIRWSCKLTRDRSFRLTQRDLDEVFDATGAIGGTGEVPGMVIRIGSPKYDVVVLRADDFIKIVTEKVAYVSESKAEQKRRVASTPILFREEE